MNKKLKTFLKVLAIIGIVQILILTFVLFSYISVGIDVIDLIFGKTPTISVNTNDTIHNFTFNNKRYIDLSSNFRIKFKSDEQAKYIAYCNFGVAYIPDRMAVYNNDTEQTFIVQSRAANSPTISWCNYINVDEYENLCNAPIVKIDDDLIIEDVSLNDLIDQNLENIDYWLPSLDCEVYIQTNYDFVDDICLYASIVYYNNELYIKKINTNTYKYSYFTIKMEYQRLFENLII